MAKKKTGNSKKNVTKNSIDQTKSKIELSVEEEKSKKINLTEDSDTTSKDLYKFDEQETKTNLPKKKKTSKKEETKKEFNEKEDNSVSKVSSRVERHQQLYRTDLSITQQQQFDFVSFNLDSTNTLDTSFLENRRKSAENHSSKKNIPESKKVVPSKKNSHGSFFYYLLVLFVLLFIGFTIYHFISYDHSQVKTITKTEKKVVVDDNYLFLGDSITDFYDLDKYYKDMPVVNSGTSGNTTTDILDHMKERVYRYNPSKVFLLIGTNDLVHDRKEEEIVSNIQKIIQGIQKNRPYCEIYLEAIYPINDSDDDKINHDVVREDRTNEKIQSINKKLKKMSEEKKITYLDMYDLLADEDGNLKLEYTKEGLHLSDKGYEKITNELKKYIEN